MKPWYVYILVSYRTGKLYTGITTDLERRLNEHNTSSRGAKYTRVGRPWTMAYHEDADSHSAALKRELAIKRMTRQAKLTLAGLAI